MKIYYDKKAGARIVYSDEDFVFSDENPLNNISKYSNPFAGADFTGTSLDYYFPNYDKCENLFNFCKFDKLDQQFHYRDITDGTRLFVGGRGFTEITTKFDKLENGTQMFSECSDLVQVHSDLSFLTVGNGMFMYCNNLTTFTANLGSLTKGTQMFQYCENLTTFNLKLSSLEYGGNMFNGCTNLTTFHSDLGSLREGTNMFNGCTSLDSFDADLSLLLNGWSMFGGCTSLTTFTSNLSSLQEGTGMFYKCTNLTSFESDLSSLTEGSNMFYGCESLTSFNSNLGSLVGSGVYDNMFLGCSLDGDSLECILKSIPDYTNDGESHHIMITLNQDGVNRISILQDELPTFLPKIESGEIIPHYVDYNAYQCIMMEYNGWTIYINTNVVGGTTIRHQ